MPFSNVFALVGKALRSATKRPLQRFNIYNRSKKYIGEESKHFFPAPRAIGPVTKIGATQYPHLEGSGGGVFKSVKQRRIEAIESRNKKLLSESNNRSETSRVDKSYSEIKQEDNMIIEASQRLPVIKTISKVERRGTDALPEGDSKSDSRLARPLPKSTNLNLQDPTAIWVVDKVPPGRLDLNKFQELMINRLADEAYWTPKKISEVYNIKEEYAKNLITYLKQIRVVVSPRMAKVLDYTNRTNEEYQATKHVIYIVDKSLRTNLDKSADGTFLPDDELDPSIRELLDAGKLEKKPKSVEELKQLYKIKRPEPLKIGSLNQAKTANNQKKSLPRAKQITEKDISS